MLSQERVEQCGVCSGMAGEQRVALLCGTKQESGSLSESGPIVIHVWDEQGVETQTTSV